MCLLLLLLVTEVLAFQLATPRSFHHRLTVSRITLHALDSGSFLRALKSRLGFLLDESVFTDALSPRDDTVFKRLQQLYATRSVYLHVRAATALAVT